MSKTTFEQVIAEKGKLVYTNVGDSMYPLILPRDLLVIEAVRQPLRRYDIPLYRRDSGQYVLHRIVAVNGDGSYAMCGDNRSQCEFGITDRHIIGVLTAIVRDGKTIPVQELPNPSQIKAAEDLILLLTCAVNGEAPDSGACAAMYSWMNSAEPSVEPSSEMTISSGRYVCANAPSSAAPIHCNWLWHSWQKEMSGRSMPEIIADFDGGTIIIFYFPFPFSILHLV